LNILTDKIFPVTIRRGQASKVDVLKNRPFCPCRASGQSRSLGWWGEYRPIWSPVCRRM